MPTANDDACLDSRLGSARADIGSSSAAAPPASCTCSPLPSTGCQGPGRARASRSPRAGRGCLGGAGGLQRCCHRGAGNRRRGGGGSSCQTSWGVFLHGRPVCRRPDEARDAHHEEQEEHDDRRVHPRRHQVIVGIAFAAQGEEAVVVVAVGLVVGVVVGLVMPNRAFLPGSAGRARRPAPTARPAP
jgi:hypothetical protein